MDSHVSFFAAIGLRSCRLVASPFPSLTPFSSTSSPTSDSHAFLPVSCLPLSPHSLFPVHTQYSQTCTRNPSFFPAALGVFVCILDVAPQKSVKY